MWAASPMFPLVKQLSNAALQTRSKMPWGNSNPWPAANSTTIKESWEPLPLVRIGPYIPREDHANWAKPPQYNWRIPTTTQEVVYQQQTYLSIYKYFLKIFNISNNKR